MSTIEFSEDFLNKPAGSIAKISEFELYGIPTANEDRVTHIIKTDFTYYAIIDSPGHTSGIHLLEVSKKDFSKTDSELIIRTTNVTATKFINDKECSNGVKFISSEGYLIGYAGIEFDIGCIDFSASVDYADIQRLPNEILQPLPGSSAIMGGLGIVVSGKPYVGKSTTMNWNLRHNGVHAAYSGYCPDTTLIDSNDHTLEAFIDSIKASDSENICVIIGKFVDVIVRVSVGTMTFTDYIKALLWSKGRNIIVMDFLERVDDLGFSVDSDYSYDAIIENTSSTSDTVILSLFDNVTDVPSGDGVCITTETPDGPHIKIKIT